MTLQELEDRIKAGAAGDGDCLSISYCTHIQELAIDLENTAIFSSSVALAGHTCTATPKENENL